MRTALLCDTTAWCEKRVGTEMPSCLSSPRGGPKGTRWETKTKANCSRFDIAGCARQPLLLGNASVVNWNDKFWLAFFVFRKQKMDAIGTSMVGCSSHFKNLSKRQHFFCADLCALFQAFLLTWFAALYASHTLSKFFAVPLESRFQR